MYPKMYRRLRKLSLLAAFTGTWMGALFVAGCPSVERSAYLTAVGAKAFTDSFRTAHAECAIVASPSVLCANLNRAVAAKDLLIDAGEIYCGGEGFEGGVTPCYPPKKGTPGYQVAVDKLTAAVKNYQQAEKDLKGVLKP